MVAKLIRNNHVNAMQYRVNFFTTALEELADGTNDNIKYNSLSARLANLNDTDYGKMFEEKPETAAHSDNLKALMEIS